MKSRLKGTVSLILCTMIWGAAFIAQTVGMEHIGPFTFQAGRGILAVLSLLAMTAIRDRIQNKNFFAGWKNKKLWISGILCGIPLFFACILQQIGLQGTGAGKAAFLTAMYVVIVPLAAWLSGRKENRTIILSVCLCLIGMFLLCGFRTEGFHLYDILLIICAVMYSVQIIIIDKTASGLDPLRFNCIQSGLCAVFSVACMWIFETPTIQNIWESRLTLAYAGILSMGVAYTLQIIGQQNLSPSAASLLMSTESVFAAIFGWLLLQQSMSLREIVGSVIMMAAIVLSQVPDRHSVRADNR